MDLLNNSLLKSMVEGKLKTLFKEQGITGIFITTGKEGQPEYQIFQEPVRVIKESEFQTIKKLLSHE